MTIPLDRRSWSFEWVTYPLLTVYFLPILFIYGAAASSQLFLDENSSLYVARAVSGAYFESFRATLGTILLPFVTAFAVKDGLVDQRVPSTTYRLFITLMAVFVALTVLYGIVEFRQVELTRATITLDGKDTSVYALFQATLMTYAKETLGYMALVLGVALGPSSKQKTESDGDGDGESGRAATALQEPRADSAASERIPGDSAMGSTRG